MTSSSRLMSVELENFMTYGQTRIDFDDTNIISLKGYNSAGKTTVLRALGVALSDLWTMNQIKFIKYGETYFRIKLNFNDGVQIIREKHANGRSAYTMLKDGDEVFSTIQNGVYTSIRGVPDVISRYLNLLDSTKLNLHLRRGRDDLLLVDTTGRENYEFLSSELKTEELTTAIGMLKTDRHAIKSDISSLEYEMDSYFNLISKEKVVTLPLVEYLEQSDSTLAKSLDKRSALDKVFTLADEYNQIKPSIPLENITYDRFLGVSSILKLIKEFNEIRVTAPVDKVKTDRFNHLRGILTSIEDLNKTQVLPKLEQVSMDRYKQLTGILVNLTALNKVDGEVNKTNKIIESLRNELNKIETWLDEQGVKVFKCKSCGEIQTGTELKHAH